MDRLLDDEGWLALFRKQEAVCVLLHGLYNFFIEQHIMPQNAVRHFAHFGCKLYSTWGFLDITPVLHAAFIQEVGVEQYLELGGSNVVFASYVDVPDDFAKLLQFLTDKRKKVDTWRNVPYRNLTEDEKNALQEIHEKITDFVDFLDNTFQEQFPELFLQMKNEVEAIFDSMSWLNMALLDLVDAVHKK